MTAATVPLIPGPPDGPGMTESADDDDLTLTWAELTDEIRQTQRTGQCARPVRLQGRIDAIDLATGELRPVYDSGTEPGGAAADRLRQPPRIRLPALLPRLQARRPAARPRRPVRRQGHPRDCRRAPVRVRHAHRPLVRAGPLPADARQDRAALPTPPRPQARAAARTAATSPARVRTRRERPAARPAAVPGLLRLPGRRAVQRRSPVTCGGGSPPTCPATSPACSASPSS